MQVTKINKFTQNQVSSLKKRLKALRDQVRDAKDSKNSSLTQVWHDYLSCAVFTTSYPQLPLGLHHTTCIVATAITLLSSFAAT